MAAFAVFVPVGFRKSRTLLDQSYLTDFTTCDVMRLCEPQAVGYLGAHEPHCVAIIHTCDFCPQFHHVSWCPYGLTHVTYAWALGYRAGPYGYPCPSLLLILSPYELTLIDT